MSNKLRNTNIVKFKSGGISSFIPRFELIPHSAMIALALRFMRGIRLKGEGAWNALTNQKPVADKQFVIDRLSHCINHCYLAIGRLSGTEPQADAEEIADGGDAGAIMFAGALLAEHLKWLKSQESVKK